jgi:hypothetical protein
MYVLLVTNTSQVKKRNQNLNLAIFISYLTGFDLSIQQFIEKKQNTFRTCNQISRYFKILCKGKYS